MAFINPRISLLKTSKMMVIIRGTVGREVVKVCAKAGHVTVPVQHGVRRGTQLQYPRQRMETFLGL